MKFDLFKWLRPKFCTTCGAPMGWRELRRFNAQTGKRAQGWCCTNSGDREGFCSSIPWPRPAPPPPPPPRIDTNSGKEQ